MIVRPVREGAQLIHQHDHARAAGSLARRWGGIPGLPAPPPALREPLFFAADNHDVGWCRLDSAPRLDPETRLPQSFFAATVEEAIAVWREGIRFCEAHGPFSGYLVSVHFGSLAEAGFAGAPAEAVEVLRGFVEGERARQEALLRGCAPEEGAFRAAAVRLLRLCDTLSLIACRAPEISPPPGAVQSLTGGGLNLRLAEEGVLELAPWPFLVAPVKLLFPGVTIPPDRFASQADLDEALQLAEPAMFETQLVPMAA
ncbi:MAG: DUF3891 family protein [Nitrospinota bacterium]